MTISVSVNSSVGVIFDVETVDPDIVVVPEVSGGGSDVVVSFKGSGVVVVSSSSMGLSRFL